LEAQALYPGVACSLNATRFAKFWRLDGASPRRLAVAHEAAVKAGLSGGVLREPGREIIRKLERQQRLLVSLFQPLSAPFLKTLFAGVALDAPVAVKINLWNLMHSESRVVTWGQSSTPLRWGATLVLTFIGLRKCSVSINSLP
jgi:hypothetical protein